MGARQSSPSMRLISLVSDLTVLVKTYGTTWKNTSADNDMLQAASFTNP
jgi:hypothetical protein